MGAMSVGPGADSSPSGVEDGDLCTSSASSASSVSSASLSAVGSVDVVGSVDAAE